MNIDNRGGGLELSPPPEKMGKGKSYESKAVYGHKILKTFPI